MNEFVILLDSTCNMTLADLEEFNIDYFKMTVSLDNKVYDADLGWKDMTPADFYETMKKGTRPYTQLVTEEEYRTKFTKYLSEGLDVLYISCSSALSSSVKVAYKVVDKLLTEFPKSKIRIVDSLNSGMGQGMMGIKAHELKEAGKTLDEVADYIEKTKLCYNQFATVGKLTYLAKAGRVKASAAFFGNIFGVQPIIISDIKGNNYAYKKVRGRQVALEEIANSIVENAVEPENNILAIDNANCVEDAKKIIALVESKGVKFKRYFTNPLGPILGASCGPDTVIAYFYGKEVTILGE